MEMYEEFYLFMCCFQDQNKFQLVAENIKIRTDNFALIIKMFQTNNSDTVLNYIT